MFSDLIQKNRTKRFYNGKNVPFNILEELIEDARYSASTMNKQEVRYILVNDKNISDEIFKITNLPSKHKVPDENRPGAFIVMVVDKDINNRNHIYTTI